MFMFQLTTLKLVITTSYFTSCTVVLVLRERDDQLSDKVSLSVRSTMKVHRVSYLNISDCFPFSTLLVVN